MTPTAVKLSRGTVGLVLAAIVLSASLAAGWAAWAEPHSRREWDERHSMDNVKSILTTGRLRPVFPLYPTLAYFPQSAVLATVRAAQGVAGAEPLAVVDSQGFATPAVYRICRLLCVLFGAAALVLTYVAGRRVFTPGVGLLAAFLVAASPWFVRGASVFKPDPLLMLLTLATFLWSLKAAERGRLTAFLLAGMGVGLTAAAKQNGALAAIPVVAAALVAPLERRRWVGLALAGLTSAAVFAALNPWPDLILHYAEIGGKYTAWVRSQTTPMPHTLVYLPQLFVSGSWHGPVVGGAALLGLLVLPLEGLRRRRTGEGGAGIAVFLAFAFGFPLACAAISSYPKTNIFLPLLPFTALAAAWTLATAWGLATQGLSAAGRRWALGLSCVALLALVIPEAAGYVHYRAVPHTTLDAVAARIERRAPTLAHRYVIYESERTDLVVERRWSQEEGVSAWVAGAPSLTALPRTALDLCDYEAFPEERLHGEESDFYLGRLTRLEARDEVWMVRPRRFELRGEPLMVLAHPWQPVEPGLPIRWRRGPKRVPTMRGQLPEGLVARQVVSLDLTLTARQATECRLLLSGEPLELHLYSWEGETLRWMTRRLALAAPKAPLRLECPERTDLDPPPAGDVWRWTRD